MNFSKHKGVFSTINHNVMNDLDHKNNKYMSNRFVHRSNGLNRLGKMEFSDQYSRSIERIRHIDMLQEAREMHRVTEIVDNFRHKLQQQENEQNSKIEIRNYENGNVISPSQIIATETFPAIQYLNAVSQYPSKQEQDDSITSSKTPLIDQNKEKEQNLQIPQKQKEDHLVGKNGKELTIEDFCKQATQVIRTEKTTMRNTKDVNTIENNLEDIKEKNDIEETEILYNQNVLVLREGGTALDINQSPELLRVYNDSGLSEIQKQFASFEPTNDEQNQKEDLFREDSIHLDIERATKATGVSNYMGDSIFQEDISRSKQTNQARHACMQTSENFNVQNNEPDEIDLMKKIQDGSVTNSNLSNTRKFLMQPTLNQVLNQSKSRLGETIMLLNKFDKNDKKLPMLNPNQIDQNQSNTELKKRYLSCQNLDLNVQKKRGQRHNYSLNKISLKNLRQNAVKPESNAKLPILGSRMQLEKVNPLKFITDRQKFQMMKSEIHTINAIVDQQSQESSIQKQLSSLILNPDEVKNLQQSQTQGMIQQTVSDLHQSGNNNSLQSFDANTSNYDPLFDLNSFEKNYNQSKDNSKTNLGKNSLLKNKQMQKHQRKVQDFYKNKMYQVKNDSQLEVVIVGNPYANETPGISTVGNQQKRTAEYSELIQQMNVQDLASNTTKSNQDYQKNTNFQNNGTNTSNIFDIKPYITIGNSQSKRTNQNDRPYEVAQQINVKSVSSDKHSNSQNLENQNSTLEDNEVIKESNRSSYKDVPKARFHHQRIQIQDKLKNNKFKITLNDSSSQFTNINQGKLADKSSLEPTSRRQNQKQESDTIPLLVQDQMTPNATKLKNRYGTKEDLINQKNISYYKNLQENDIKMSSETINISQNKTGISFKMKQNTLELKNTLNQSQFNINNRKDKTVTPSESKTKNHNDVRRKSLPPNSSDQNQETSNEKLQNKKLSFINEKSVSISKISKSNNSQRQLGSQSKRDLSQIIVSKRKSSQGDEASSPKIQATIKDEKKMNIIDVNEKLTQIINQQPSKSELQKVQSQYLKEFGYNSKAFKLAVNNRVGNDQTPLKNVTKPEQIQDQELNYEDQKSNLNKEMVKKSIGLSTIVQNSPQYRFKSKKQSFNNDNDNYTNGSSSIPKARLSSNKGEIVPAFRASESHKNMNTDIIKYENQQMIIEGKLVSLVSSVDDKNQRIKSVKDYNPINYYQSKMSQFNKRNSATQSIIEDDFQTQSLDGGSKTLDSAELKNQFNAYDDEKMELEKTIQQEKQIKLMDSNSLKDQPSPEKSHELDDLIAKQNEQILKILNAHKEMHPQFRPILSRKLTTTRPLFQLKGKAREIELNISKDSSIEPQKSKQLPIVEDAYTSKIFENENKAHRTNKAQPLQMSFEQKTRNQKNASNELLGNDDGNSSLTMANQTRSAFKGISMSRNQVGGYSNNSNEVVRSVNQSSAQNEPYKIQIEISKDDDNIGEVEKLVSKQIERKRELEKPDTAVNAKEKRRNIDDLLGNHQSTQLSLSTEMMESKIRKDEVLSKDFKSINENDKQQNNSKLSEQNQYRNEELSQNTFNKSSLNEAEEQKSLNIKREDTNESKNVEQDAYQKDLKIPEQNVVNKNNSNRKSKLSTEILQSRISTIQSVREGQEVINQLITDEDQHSPPHVQSTTNLETTLNNNNTQANTKNNTQENPDLLVIYQPSLQELNTISQDDKTIIRNLDSYLAIRDLIMNYSNHQDFRIKMKKWQASHQSIQNQKQPQPSRDEILSKLAKHRVTYHWTQKRQKQQNLIGAHSLSPKKDEYFEKDGKLNAEKIQLEHQKQGKFSIYQLAMVGEMTKQHQQNIIKTPKLENVQAFLESQKLSNFNDENINVELTQQQLDELKEIDPELRDLIDKFYQLGSHIFGAGQKHLLNQRILQIFEMAMKERNPYQFEQFGQNDILNLQFRNDDTKTTNKLENETSQNIRSTKLISPLIEERQVEMSSKIELQDLSADMRNRVQSSSIKNEYINHEEVVPWRMRKSNSHSRFNVHSLYNSQMHNIPSTKNQSQEKWSLYYAGKKDDLGPLVQMPNVPLDLSISRVKIQQNRFKFHKSRQ